MIPDDRVLLRVLYDKFQGDKYSLDDQDFDSISRDLNWDRERIERTLTLLVTQGYIEKCSLNTWVVRITRDGARLLG